MRIAVLSGSPHKRGTTSRLVDSFVKGAMESDHVVTRFDVAFCDVHPCIACDHCQSDDRACVYRDDMLQIGSELAQADCIVFVTPIYYYGICAQLKTVIDRFYAMEKQIRRNQKTFFITAMADDNQDTIKAANDSYMAFVRWLDWNDCGILNAFVCTTPEDLNGTDYEARAYELGKNIG